MQIIIIGDCAMAMPEPGEIVLTCIVLIVYAWLWYKILKDEL